MSSYEFSNLDPAKATQMLKEMLQLGKPASSSSGANVDGHNSAMASTNGNVDVRSLPSAIVGHSESGVVKQEIDFNVSDETVSYSVYGNDVTIKCSTADHESGSSKVKIRNIVNSGWENKYYVGQQVATHLSKEYIAYAIKLPSSTDGAVRVIGRRIQGRVLLRGMKGLITDLSFARTTSEAVLASIDEFGNFFVHSIKKDDNNLVGNLLLEIRRPEETRANNYHRIIWCPYIPDDSAEDDGADVSKILIVANHNVAEIWNIETVVKEYGCGPHTVDKISVGYQQIKEHTQPITDAAFSPEGTAFATVGCDGAVKFFQMGNLESSRSQRCIHHWKPHNEKPLSCLLFLDNLRNPNPEVQFWKFAITGANKNRELKVWNCATWECLQTIRFEVSLDDSVKAELKAGLDDSSEFLILSDVAHRVLYIFQIFQDPDNNVAQITSISEFNLTYPILSFSILEAARKKLKQCPDMDQVDESPLCETIQGEMDDEKKESDFYLEGVVVKLVYIQPKSLQECHITFQPMSPISDSGGSFSTLSQDALSFRDRLSDLSFETSSDIISNDVYGQMKSPLTSSRTLSIGGQLLLTPDVFSSPNLDVTSKEEPRPNTSGFLLADQNNEQNLMSLEDLPTLPTELQTLTSSYRPNRELRQSSTCRSPSQEKQVSSHNNDLNYRKPLQSTGSSPSLEVQEILTKTMDVASEDSSFQSHNDNIANKTKTSNQEPATDLKSLIRLQTNNVQENASKDQLHPSRQTPSPSFENAGDSVENSNPVKWPTAPKLQEYTLQDMTGNDEDRKGLKSPDFTETNNEDFWMASGLFTKRTSNQLEILTHSIQSLSQMLEQQQMELTDLRSTIVDLKSQTEGLSDTLQNDLNTSVKSLFQKYHQADANSITSLLKTHEDRLMSALSQMVDNSIMNRLDSNLKTEFRNNVVPVMTREMGNLEAMLHTEVTQRLAATDLLMRENIGKLVESKAFVSGISHAVASCLQGVIRSIFQDAFQNSLLPAFDKSCQSLFLQIDENFRKGTKDYALHLESCLEKQQLQGQTIVASQLQSFIDNFRSSTEQFSISAADKMEKKISTTLLRFEEHLTNNFCSLVKEQMTAIIKQHEAIIEDTVVNAIKSRAVTPIINADPHAQQAHILHLLQQGQLNAAFQQALSAVDLNLVIFVCEKVNPSREFNKTPFPLQQPVLLSLIHQLSSDLNSHTELKQEYLKEAVVNLDFKDPVTVSHAPSVIETLCQKLQLFIQLHPSGKVTSNMKVLLMAAKSVLGS